MTIQMGNTLLPEENKFTGFPPNQLPIFEKAIQNGQGVSSMCDAFGYDAKSVLDWIETEQGVKDNILGQMTKGLEYLHVKKFALITEDNMINATRCQEMIDRFVSKVYYWEEFGQYNEALVLSAYQYCNQNLFETATVLGVNYRELLILISGKKYITDVVL